MLLLDEVAVTDVADALLMRKLFRRLFHSGIIVVATSNRAPSELYLNGLQRTSFLPFIADVEARCVTHRLDSTTDYRTQATAASGVATISPDGHGTGMPSQFLWFRLARPMDSEDPAMQRVGSKAARAGCADRKDIKL